MICPGGNVNSSVDLCFAGRGHSPLSQRSQLKILSRYCSKLMVQDLWVMLGQKKVSFRSIRSLSHLISRRNIIITAKTPLWKGEKAHTSQSLGCSSCQILLDQSEEAVRLLLRASGASWFWLSGRRPLLPLSSQTTSEASSGYCGLCLRLLPAGRGFGFQRLL